MARIYEYQGKQLLKTVGVPIPRGEVVSTPQEAKRVAKEIGRPVAIKAQVWATGRFKAGGIQFAETPEEAERVAEKILSSKIKGLSVGKVLVEEKLNVDKEYYIGVIVDSSYKVKAPVIVSSTEGGVDIEEVASRNPERVARMVVRYRRGVEISDGKFTPLQVIWNSTKSLKPSVVFMKPSNDTMPEWQRSTLWSDQRWSDMRQTVGLPLMIIPSFVIPNLGLNSLGTWRGSRPNWRNWPG